MPFCFTHTFSGRAKPVKHIIYSSAPIHAAANAGRERMPEMGWFTQDKNEDIHTKVNDDNDDPQTEFIIAQRDGSGHDHIVISQDGDITSHTFREETPRS